MKTFAKKLLVFVMGSLIADFAYSAITNIMDGKDILGNQIERKEHHVDPKGRVHLGTNDYQIV